MPSNNKNNNRSGRFDNSPSLVESFDGDNYVVGSDCNNNSQRYNYNGGHPYSPSSFSQLTTATLTRRDEYNANGEDDDDDGPVVIRVIAPATLQEGYEFDVLVDDEPYTVRVPPGGVKEGQEFETDYDPRQEYKYNNNTTNTNSNINTNNNQNHNNGRSGSSRRMQMQQLVEEDDEGPSTDGYSQEERRRRHSQRSANNSSSGSHHRQQKQQMGSNNMLSSARIYDDGSEYTAKDDEEGNNKKDNIEQALTFPAQSLSGDAAEEEDDTANKENDNAEDENDNEDPEEAVIWYDGTGTPIGGWRTRLCSCCDVLTQSTCWMGFCCTPILMAQLITRLGLTWNGREGPQDETSLSYNRIVLGLVFTMATFWVPVMGILCLFIFYLVVIVYIGSHVRGYMRQKYKIPSTLPTRCGDRVDDVCLMLCCGCCSSIQMARHTHDDKDYPGHGCTTTGLEFDAPEIV